jgi:hypothetical protein
VLNNSRVDLNNNDQIKNNTSQFKSSLEYFLIKNEPQPVPQFLRTSDTPIPPEISSPKSNNSSVIILDSSLNISLQSTDKIELNDLYLNLYEGLVERIYEKPSRWRLFYEKTGRKDIRFTNKNSNLQLKLDRITDLDLRYTNENKNTIRINDAHNLKQIDCHLKKLRIKPSFLDQYKPATETTKKEDESNEIEIIFFKPSESEIVVLNDQSDTVPKVCLISKKLDTRVSNNLSKSSNKLRGKEVLKKILRKQVELETRAEYRKQNPIMESTTSKFNASIKRIRLNIEMEQRIETMSWVVKKFEQEPLAEASYRQLSFFEDNDLEEIENIKTNLKKSLQIFLLNTTKQ